MPKDRADDIVPNTDERRVECPDCEHIFFVTKDCKLAECPICVTEFRV